MTKSSLSIWHILHNVKRTVKILSIFMAFFENMKFNYNRVQSLFEVASKLLQTYDVFKKIFFDKGGFKSNDTRYFLCCQIKYSWSLSWAENLIKLFTFLGGKFKFSAQDSNLEYLIWQHKNSRVSSDLKPPLAKLGFIIKS